MSEGFGEPIVPGRAKRHKDWAERSLEKSSKELKMLRKVIEQYKDDPKGRAKMMKKMKKYWSSNVATIKNLDYKPKGEDFWTKVEQEVADQRQEIEANLEAENAPPEPIDMMEEDMTAIREYLQASE